MIIDTSAVVAILFQEPEQELFVELIKNADIRLISAASVLETSMVVEASFGEVAVRQLDQFPVDADITFRETRGAITAKGLTARPSTLGIALFTHSQR